MNKQEAIKALTWTKDNLIISAEYKKAIDMAIEALQDDWIPVSEPPKENGNYIVSLEDAVDTSASFFNGKWFMQAFDSISREYGKHEVLAWQPLPDPYKGGDTE